MKNKIAVQFRKSPKTLYVLPRVKHCRHCGNFTTLWLDRCLKCAHEKQWITFAQLTSASSAFTMQRDFLIVGIASLFALVAARTLFELILSIVVGILCAVAFHSIHKRYRQGLENHQSRKIVESGIADIHKGIELDRNDAVLDETNKNVKEAYEKLREISLFINTESVKRKKLQYLQHIVLRKDMELELSSLLPEQFSKSFAEYLGQVCKLNPQLIRSDVFDYVVRYQKEILKLDDGEELLQNIAGAALRMKKYVRDYHRLIIQYADTYSRDRMLRLLHLLDGESEELKDLRDKVWSIARMHYHYDPEFQPFLERAN